jgi:CO/xanthine dehydrogenase FAD-binding subunit
LIEITNYVKAESLEQAYQLNQKRANLILGGMLWTKMKNRRIQNAIDLSGLGLDTIEETDDAYLIGAMVTLRQLEQHPGIAALTQGAARDSVKDIVGVQFRNLATVGGSLYGRFGFSDVLTFFMAAGASVELYKRGILSVEEFAKLPYDNDILVRAILPKTPQRIVYLSQRNTKTDFPVLTCCVSVRGDEVLTSIGARPMRAVLFRDEQGILAQGITKESAEAFGSYIKDHVKTGSNMRGSAQYRSILAQVLTRRALLKTLEEKKED